MLATVASWAQTPVIPKKPTNFPDCNRLNGVPFRDEAVGTFDHRAGKLFAMLMDSAKASVGISDSLALAKAKYALDTATSKRVYGYVGGITLDAKGHTCISVTETPAWVDAVPFFRWNDEWMVYLRTGCGNIVLVYEPRQQTPRDAYENPPVGNTYNFVDNRAYQYNLKMERTPLQQMPATPFCCPKFGETEFSAYFQIRHLSGNVLLQQGTQPVLGLEMINRRLFLGPDYKIYGRPLGWKSIAELYMEASDEFDAPCDTCGVWVLDSGNQLRLGISLGSGPVILNWHPFKDASWFSMRFALLLRYETKLKKSEHAGWSGFFIEPEAEFLIGRSNKIHGKIALAANWHPFPSNPTEFGPGAWNSLLSASIVYPFANKEEVEEKRLKKAQATAKKAKEQAQRDTVMARESFLADSNLVREFLKDTALISTLGLDSLMTLPVTDTSIVQTKRLLFVKFKTSEQKLYEAQYSVAESLVKIQTLIPQLEGEKQKAVILGLANEIRVLEEKTALVKKLAGKKKVEKPVPTQ